MPVPRFFSTAEALATCSPHIPKRCLADRELGRVSAVSAWLMGSWEGYLWGRPRAGKAQGVLQSFKLPESFGGLLRVLQHTCLSEP